MPRAASARAPARKSSKETPVQDEGITESKTSGIANTAAKVKGPTKAALAAKNTDTKQASVASKRDTNKRPRTENDDAAPSRNSKRSKVEENKTSITTKAKAVEKETAPKGAEAKKTAAAEKVEPKVTASKLKAAPKPKAPKAKIVINTAPTAVKTTFVMGEGSAGELGLGATKKATGVMRPRLNQLLEEMGVVDLAVGGMHTLALTKDNKILSWGVNDNKALGRPLPEWSARQVDDDDDSDEDDEGLDLNPHEATPTAIPQESFPAGTIFTSIAAGDSASFAVTDDGLVYGWGTFRNDNGVWGFALDKNGKVLKEQTAPVLIEGLKNITQVSCGDNHALALDSKGVAWAWGSGQQDQLGRRIVNRHAHVMLRPVKIAFPRGTPKIVSIAAGPNHSFAIDGNGTAWAWGLNNFMQTGISYGEDQDNDIITIPTKVTQLSDYKLSMIGTGANHTIVLTESGDLLAFGRLENWALGVKVDEKMTADTDVIRVNTSGRPSILIRPTRVEVDDKFAYVACGPDHNIAISRKGDAWAWGFNANHQCGFGRDVDEVKVPERLVSKWIQGLQLNWAGCGGQFSIISATVGAKQEAKADGV